ncbi:hypothetical protein CGGC5_v004091 [Colletotrichum fructicola Nara gc5]|uniref:Uncharacterized protein n=1 Tax=Colletotrichum fructicola (strain Nara gc5) TaxID=1213859 RepID=A0A7J6JHL2_COLFN|nr:hypothetical protein CGGC5_v004091 [Colletotrichum fructicola Nara gc5]
MTACPSQIPPPPSSSSQVTASLCLSLSSDKTPSVPNPRSPQPPSIGLRKSVPPSGHNSRSAHQPIANPARFPSIPSVQRTAAPQVKAADDDSDSVAPHPRAAARPDLLDSSSNYLQTNTNDDNPHTPDDDD